MEEGNRGMLEFMITAILNDYDLTGIILRGKPDDDYGPEARYITTYLEEHNYEVKLDILAEYVRYTFYMWFDEYVDIVPCIMIANEIKKMI